ncbi:FecCD family ABC transporter permease [Croceiramulus getboli]|nr:iron ABC transporter permease [Flavobacteriaceae bacterium YJPT1-3]
MNKQGHIGIFLALIIGLLVVWLMSLTLGSIWISLSEVFAALTQGSLNSEANGYIITHYRLPKSITAILAGAGLATAGLLMQTLFRNPLAGPFVLGVSSGASLGVALLVLGTSVLGFSPLLSYSKWGTVIAATLGSLIVLFAILMVAKSMKDTMALLIVGLMFGSLTAAVVSVLAYFSKAEELQRYIFWSFGNLGDNSWQAVGILALSVGIGLLLTTLLIKPLNALLMGEHYARSMGVAVGKSRILMIVATCLMAGAVTAFAGPIAFIGLAVPHLIRQWVPGMDHRFLFPACALGGAILLLVCDLIAQLPMSSYTLPINAITALVGAPVVIWLLLRRKKLIF